jgi:hypothetical protein
MTRDRMARYPKWPSRQMTRVENHRSACLDPNLDATTGFRVSPPSPQRQSHSPRLYSQRVPSGPTHPPPPLSLSIAPSPPRPRAHYCPSEARAQARL